MIAIWKDIPGFEGRYQVNEMAQVRSLTRTVIAKTGQTYTLPGRILKPNKIKNGYLIVHLHKNNIESVFYVHQLVAELFIPNPNQLPIVNHKDGNKQRCEASNLEWTTYSGNNQHAYDTGLKPRGEGQYKAKLKESDIVEIRKLGKYDTFEHIACKYGVSKATIRDVILFRTWKHVT